MTQVAFGLFDWIDRSTGASAPALQGPVAAPRGGGCSRLLLLSPCGASRDPSRYGAIRNDRASRSMRVTTRASPDRRKSSKTCSSVRPSQRVPLAFSARITSQPAAFSAARWMPRQGTLHTR